MTVEEKVVAKLRALPEAKRLEVLDFVEFLENRSQPMKPLKDMMGVFSDQDIHVTEEDIAEARKEMWGNFPRDDIA